MEDNGEGPSTGPRFHATLSHNYRPYPRSSALEDFGSSTEDSVFDTPMDSVTVDGYISPVDPIPTASDFEYNSHDSDPDDFDVMTPTNDNGAGIPNTDVGSMVDMGQAIAYSFPVDMEYDVNYDDRHIFDHGVSGDETDYSDLSSNYEELTEPDIIFRVVDVPSEEQIGRGTSDVETDNSADDNYESSDEDSTDGEGQVGEISSVVNDGSIMHVDGPEQEATIGVELVAASGPNTLDELQKADLHFQQCIERRESKNWKLLELQEELRHIEREISEKENELQEEDEREDMPSQRNRLEADMRNARLSPGLFEAYKSFCESLYPEYGLREGFSITCNEHHDGSYAAYDPEFQIFKDFVEMDYHECNFRCEAKEVSTRFGGRESIVEFWPIESPELLSGDETTWRELYPTLYQLAIEAASNGSQVAMEMLIRLPEMHSTFSGGWLFDYESEELLQFESIVSKRWRFRSAHSIDFPVSVQDKKNGLEELVLQYQNTQRRNETGV